MASVAPHTVTALRLLSSEDLDEIVGVIESVWVSLGSAHLPAEHCRTVHVFSIEGTPTRSWASCRLSFIAPFFCKQIRILNILGPKERYRDEIDDVPPRDATLVVLQLGEGVSDPALSAVQYLQLPAGQHVARDGKGGKTAP